MLIANLEYYKVFYYAVKCGSVTRASEVLSLSQPAVSQSLKQLERILGIRLLRRTSRGISPTAEGQLLFSFVEKGQDIVIAKDQLFLLNFKAKGEPEEEEEPNYEYELLPKENNIQNNNTLPAEIN